MHVLIPQPLVKFIERILPKNHLIAHNVYQGYYVWFVKISSWSSFKLLRNRAINIKKFCKFKIVVHAV